MNKTEVIKNLVEAEKQYGLVETLHYVFGQNIRVNIGFTSKACDSSIEELALSVRSYNALRRANVSTLGDLIGRLNQGGLKSIRNLGVKSYREIQTKMLVYGFDLLSEKEQIRFFDDLIENNK